MMEERDIERFTKQTPPDLERLLGYRGIRRWVAFFWGKKIGDSTLCHGFDGKAFVPVNLAAWNAFFSHPLIVAINHSMESGHTRKRFEFGNEQKPSERWLLMDRDQRVLYAARKDKALCYLRMGIELQEGVHLPPAQTAYGALQMIDEMLQWLDRAMLSRELSPSELMPTQPPKMRNPFLQAPSFASCRISVSDRKDH